MKEWKVKKNEFGEEWHELRFSPFYEDDDEVIASFVQDEMDDEAFYYISKELSADDDLLWADSIDDAKQQIEEMLIEHWKDEIEYLEDRLKEFQEKINGGKVMQVELKVNGKTVHAEISEEQAKILGLVEDTPKTGYERGKNGKLYYCVEEDGHLLRYAEGNDSADDNFYGIGNYYSDKTIAENNARADRLLRQLKQWQAQNDKAISISDWKNEGIIKYFIAYNYRSSLFEIGRCSRRREPNIIYFTTKDKVSKAVKNFRDELEWYFTEYQQRLDEE